MKKLALLTAALSAALFSVSSCVSTKTMFMVSADETAGVEVIGKVNTTFTSFQWFHMYTKNGMGKKAYKKLKQEAEILYGTDNKIDVVNVTAEGEFSGWDVLMYLCASIFGNFQTIYAKGDVVAAKSGGAVQPNAPKPKELEKAIKRAASNMVNELPNGSKVAVVNVESDDKTISSLVIDEVEFNLVSAKRFTIVDRNALNLIQEEQQFQMSGAVSDDDVVKIGALSGANVVIAGSIIKSGRSNRLSLKALDVKTGQIITMARESY